MTELRAMTQGVTAPAAAPDAGAPSSSTAALFQQQMLAAGLADPSAEPGGAPVVPGAPDPYAALQGGGLSTQAAMLAQLTGGASQAAGSAGLAGMPGVALPGAGGVPAPASAAPTHVTGKLDGLSPELLAKLDAVGRELGQPIDVISGNRTFEEQSRLYDAYRNGTGNLAAPPGHSNHERGAAADVYVGGVALASVPGAAQIAERNGLHFPVGGEAWHVEQIN